MLSIQERIQGYEPFFGKWRLASQNPLGEGTSGIVYPIRNGEYEAALKVIPIPKNERFLRDIIARCKSDAEVRRELERELGYVKDEIKTMKLLEGESNIVYFTESVIYGRSDTYGWDVLICMEKLVRIDTFLKDPVRYGCKKDHKLIMKIWLDMVEGLCVCERNNIVHFDIKPENIFYAPGKNHFKLGDFGVAINTRGRQNVMQGGFVGTRDYASPEMLNRQGGDSRSDIYSLAMVIYQLFNDYHIPFVPVGTPNTKDDFNRAVEERVVKRRRIPPIKGVNKEAMQILLKCLEYDPANRYPSFDALRNDLLRIIYRGGKQPVPVVVPIIAVAASLGVAGAMVAIGMNTMKKDPTPEVTAPVAIVETTVPVVTEYPTEIVQQITVPPAEDSTEPEITATPEPQATPEPSFRVYGNFHNYFDNNGQMLSVLSADISGDVQIYATLDGRYIPANRIEDNTFDNLPGDWGIRRESWPTDGIYYIISVPEFNVTHTLSLEAKSLSGEILYSKTVEFHLKEISGQPAFMDGARQIDEVRYTGYGFDVVDGSYTGPNQTYTFYGSAEPETQIHIYLNTADNRIASITSNTDGSWAYDLEEILIKGSGNHFCLLAGYDDKQLVRSDDFIYDDRISEITVSGSVLADSAKVCGYTEGGAQVVFALNGKEIAGNIARQDGYFEIDISGTEMFENDNYALIVTDRVGNSGSISGSVGRRAEFAQIYLSSPVKGVRGREESIVVSGTAQGGEKIEIIAEEINYKDTIKLNKNGTFDEEIKLPENIPASINLVVRYQNNAESEISCLLEYDTMCELSASDSLTVGRTDIQLISEPFAEGHLELLSSEGTMIGERIISCDAEGKYTANLADLLPLEGDQVVVSVQDAYGNTAECEIPVYENTELRKLSRVDKEARQISESQINRNSFEVNGLRLEFEGYPGRSVILQLFRGEEKVHSCYMNENNGMYYADLKDVVSGSGDYTATVRYEDRIDKNYQINFSLAIDIPEITITSEVSEGSRRLSGITTPDSSVTLFDASTSVVLASTFANRENGEFMLTFDPIEEGDYVIQAIDVNENVGMIDLNVAKRTELTIGRADFSDSVITSNMQHLDLYGVADPNRRILLMLNGEEFAAFDSGDAGWSYRIDINDLPEGEFELSVMYASGEGSVASFTCVKDTVCHLEVNQFDQSAQFIVGLTDVDATVGLFDAYNGEQLATANVMGNGQFAIDLMNAVDLPLDPDRQLVVRAVDAVGNVVDHTVQANRVVRDQITLQMKPDAKNGFLKETAFNVSGKAAKNTELLLVLESGGMSWEHIVSAKLGEYSCSVELPAEITEGEVRISINYADGLAAESGAERKFFVDRAGPVLKLDKTTLSPGPQDITGTSNDSAEVILLVNGKKASTCKPSDSGSFKFEYIQLAEDDVIQTISEDAAGNAGSSVQVEVGKLIPSAGGMVRISESEYSVGDTIHVEGWLAYNSVRGIQVRFYNEGEHIRGEAIKKSDMREMTADELARAIAELDEPIDVQNGYTFSKDITIGADWISGIDYDVALFFDMPQPVTMFQDGVGFSIAKSEIGIDVNSVQVGSNYVFGMDAQQPRSAYSSSNIVLSGWIYGDQTVSGEIGALIIKSADGTVVATREFDERITDPADLGYVDGVYYARRSAALACPNPAEYGLADIVPVDSNAGFIVVLNEELPDGDYIVTFETTFEGKYEETISAVLRIDSTARDSCITVANEVLQRWTDELSQLEAQTEE